MSGIVLWLIPGGNNEPFFSNTIGKFSEAYNAPVFIPHITVGRIPEKNSLTVPSIIADIGEQTAPFSLRTKDPECRSYAYQKLVIPLFPDKNFQSLCATIDHVLDGNYSKREDPHISLLYSSLDCNRIYDDADKMGGHIPGIAEIKEIAAVELRGRPDAWNVLSRKKFHSPQ